MRVTTVELISICVATGREFLDFSGELILNISSHGCHRVEIVHTQIGWINLNAKVRLYELNYFNDVKRVDKPR